MVPIKKSKKKKGHMGMWSYWWMVSSDSLMGCLQTTLDLDIHAFNKCCYTHTLTHTHTHAQRCTHIHTAPLP